MTYLEEIEEAAKYLRPFIKEDIPEAAVVLGSGLSSFGEKLTDIISIPFKEIPFFKSPKVSGHGQEILLGKIGEKNILIMKGRIHYYEGYSMLEATFPIRVFQKLGIKKLILTNAAGGLKGNPGDLMLIKDHLSFFCPNPLRGANLDEFGERFPDATNIYSERLRTLAKEVGARDGLNLLEGVYAFMTGPTYETPSEIKALGILGADCVGMSTVPEALVASHGKMEVLAVSLITNAAAGVTAATLSHQEVIAVGKLAEKNFGKLIYNTILKL